MRTHVGLGLLLALMLALTVLVAPRDAGRATFEPTFVATVGIDADPSAMPANTATSLGCIDTCVEVTPDETFDIDTFLHEIPSGRGLSGFNYFLNFDDTRLEITAQNHDMLINAALGSSVTDLSEGVPDTNASHTAAVADLGTTEMNPPYTQGVLGRYTLHALAAAPAGLANLTLTTVAVSDDTGEYTVNVTDAQIAIAASCPPVPDSDGDGFDDDVECYVGTDSLDDCPDDLGDDCWPPDVNMDTVVDVIDAVTFFAAFPSAEGSPNYSQRLDLADTDGVIDVIDAIKFVNYFPSACTNP